MRARPILFAAAALVVGAVALASPAGILSDPNQTNTSPYDLSQTPAHGFTATSGAMLDAGYPAGITNGTEMTALAALECEARMVRDGYNTVASNIITTQDPFSQTVTVKRKVTAVAAQAVMLDAGVEVPQSAAVTGMWFWRPIAGADAGLHWFPMAAAPAVVGANKSRQVNFYDVKPDGTTSSLAMPGFYCFVPTSAPGYGVSHIWVRLWRVLEPR